MAGTAPWIGTKGRSSFPSARGTGEEYRDLFDVYLPIGVGVFVIIAAVVVFVVLRFRSDSDELPEGKDKDTPVELAYAGFVGLIVAGLLYLTFSTMSDDPAYGTRDEAVAAARGPRIAVTAAQWNWTFDYGGGVVERGRLVVPADTPVRFVMTSVDVVHSFWIPEVRYKQDAFPERTSTFVLRFPRPGFLPEGGLCNQYCGLLHYRMVFDVLVVQPEDFKRWLAQQRTRAAS